MGLDSYWIMPQGRPRPTFPRTMTLCGGMLSEHGVGSFRGKVYHALIDHVSGIGLYQEEISNEDVRKISQALDRHPYEEACAFSDYGIREQEYEDLKLVFREYAKAGAVLVGSW